MHGTEDLMAEKLLPGSRMVVPAGASQTIPYIPPFVPRAAQPGVLLPEARGRAARAVIADGRFDSREPLTAADRIRIGSEQDIRALVPAWLLPAVERLTRS